MEALFSSFHIGNVGVGVIGSRHGHPLGRLAGLWQVGVLSVRVQENVKKPCKPVFTGLVVVTSHRVLT